MQGFLPHFHYNKDWNKEAAPQLLKQYCASYPTSIITRIETAAFKAASIALIAFFLPHFHYNKDWNSVFNSVAIHFIETFLPHFHYNKDWNSIDMAFMSYIIKPSYPTSIITRIETVISGYTE